MSYTSVEYDVDTDVLEDGRGRPIRVTGRITKITTTREDAHTTSIKSEVVDWFDHLVNLEREAAS